MGFIRVMKTKVKEIFFKVIFLISAAAFIIAVALICFFILAKGIPAIGEIGFVKFIFGQKWAPTDVPDYYGIFPMIIGSLYVTAGALLIGMPLGIFTAIFITKFCPLALYKFLKPLINLLAGIPSVVYGFFGLTVIVPFIRDYLGGSGNSILSASILLGIMILPTIISITESALKAVPESYYEGALALGATKERSIFRILLPAARSGVVAGIVLSLGRAIGETMAVVLVIGNQTILPESILDGVRTLTTNIVLEMGYAEGLHREALFGTAVVLFVFIVVINLIVTTIKRKNYKYD